MARHLLMDFEPMVLLAALRVGEEAYGVQIAREIAATSGGAYRWVPRMLGGLGIAALALLMTLVMPGAWWLLLGSVLAGVPLGVVMIATHRSTIG